MDFTWISKTVGGNTLSSEFLNLGAMDALSQVTLCDWGTVLRVVRWWQGPWPPPIVY